MNYKLIHNRFFFKEISKNSLLILFILVTIFSLLHFLEELSNNYPIKAKVEYIFLSIPSNADLLSSLAILIGSIVFIGRLASNMELVIFFTGGMKSKEFIKKILLVTFLLSVIFSIIGEFLSPVFYEKSRQVKSIASGQVYSISDKGIWLKKDDLIINIGNTNDGKNFSDITIYEFNNKNLSNYISSKSGELIDSRLVLKNFDLLQINNNLNTNLNYLSSLSKNKVEIGLNSGEISSLSKDLKTMSIMALINHTLFLRSYALSYDKYLVEIFDRISKPFITTGLLALAIPFVLRINRTIALGKMIFLSISLALAFNLLAKTLNIFVFNFGLGVLTSQLLKIGLILIFAIISLRKTVSKI